MEDEKLRELTASERLTLEEEYEMQSVYQKSYKHFSLIYDHRREVEVGRRQLRML